MRKVTFNKAKERTCPGCGGKEWVMIKTASSQDRECKKCSYKESVVNLKIN